MQKLIALGLGTYLGFAGVLSGCSGGSNTATTTTAGGNGVGGTSNVATSAVGGSSAGGTTNAPSGGAGALGGNPAVTSTVTSGTGPVAIGDLAREVAIAVCKVITRCVAGSYAAQFLGDMTQCFSQLEPSATDQLVSQLTAAIARGTATYDAAAARACLDSYTQLNCDYSNELDLMTKCAAAWVGSVATGGSCVSNLECTGNVTSSYCASDGTCPGHCQTRSPQGQNCRMDDDCQVGLKCDATNDVCVPGLKLGDPCVSGDETTGACKGITTCRQDVTSNQYHCAPLADVAGLSEGQVCDAWNQCASTLICTATGELSDASSASVVYRCQKPAASGGACRYALGNPCPDGEYCPVPYSDATTGSAHCTAQNAPNQTCQGTYAYECQGSGRCSSTTKTCRPLNHIGGACETSGDCYSSVCTNSLCAAPQDCSR